MEIDVLSVVRLSDFRAAGSMSQKFLRFQKDIRMIRFINGKVLLIITWDAFGFSTGLGIVHPYSVDLSVFCGSFRLESKTTIEIGIGHDVLFIIQVLYVLEKTVFLKL